MKLSALILLLSTAALSQIPPDRDALLKGDPMGQASVAVAYGFPAPKRAMDLAKELDLSQEQMKSLKSVSTEVTTRSKELADRIIRVEEEMNDAFKTGLVGEKSVRDDAEQIGRLRGRLRATHLVSYVKTKAILTDKQFELYKKLSASAKK